MQKKKPWAYLLKTSLHFISILLRLCSVAQKAGVFKGKYQHIVIINQLIQAVLRGNNISACSTAVFVTLPARRLICAAR